MIGVRSISLRSIVKIFWKIRGCSFYFGVRSISLNTVIEKEEIEELEKEIILQMSNDINDCEEESISKDYNYYKSYGYFK